jgi:hypothetical protein
VYVQRRCGIARIDVVALANLLDRVDGWIVYVPSIKLCSDLPTFVSLLLLLLLLLGAFELLEFLVRCAIFPCRSCCRCNLSCGVQSLPVVADDRAVALLLAL